MSQSQSSQRQRPRRALDYDLDSLIDLSQPTPPRPRSKNPIDAIDLTDSPEPTILSPAPGCRGKGGLYPLVPTAPLSPSTRPNNARARPLSSQPSLSSSSIGSQREVSLYDDFDFGFGSSISKPKKTAPTPSKLSQSSAPRMANDYGAYIRPATAFKSAPRKSAFDQPGYRDGWPEWVSAPVSKAPSPQSAPEPEDKDKEPEEVEMNGEDFDLNQAKFTAEDFERFHGDPEEQMRNLLAGAVGEGEGEGEEDEEGADMVEGFADGMRLMPHQVRGVKWMRERETGRKYGGILADDMGLGKTVQTLARVVEGRHTPSEKKAYKGGTLIIAPLAVMEQWATEARTKTQPGLLKITTHHGPGRASTGKELEKYDLVITTFQVLASEYKARTQRTAPSDSDDSDDGLRKKLKRKKKTMAALYQVKWLRIVVDEAQNIKNHKTQTAKAAVELKAKYRWCLTGTPIQNNVEELFSLFQFLRARPLDNWQVFKARISSEVKNGRTGMAMKRLHIILKAIMLRRTKDATINGKPILNLPERRVEVVKCEFEEDEREFYDALEKKTQLTFNKFVNAGTAMANYTSVLTMLLRLRQACDHPLLVSRSAVDSDTLGRDGENFDREMSADGVEFDDGADLADLISGLTVAGPKKCELCSAPLPGVGGKHCLDCVRITRRAGSEARGLPPSSAKIRMLLKLIREVDSRSKSTEKTIVFSQFTSFLDLIEPYFRSEGIDYVRYDGSLAADKRQDVLQTIRTSPKHRVILISFKAGSTGLNLTCCNNVVLMDLWWNPALEDQAFDRAHRLGQTRAVNIWKLTVEETVEDRILDLQNQKRELAKAVLSGEGAKNLKLTMADIMKLFARSHDEE